MTIGRVVFSSCRMVDNLTIAMQSTLIFEVLTNRNGEAWKMRCCSQEEMAELVGSAI